MRSHLLLFVASFTTLAYAQRPNATFCSEPEMQGVCETVVYSSYTPCQPIPNSNLLGAKGMSMRVSTLTALTLSWLSMARHR